MLKLDDPTTAQFKKVKTMTEEKENTALEQAAGEAQDVGGVAGQRLKSFIERIERLNEEKTAISEDIKEVLAEAKGTGFDTKIIRKIISLRKQEPEKRDEEESLLELYKSAIGMM